MYEGLIGLEHADAHAATRYADRIIDGEAASHPRPSELRKARVEKEHRSTRDGSIGILPAIFHPESAFRKLGCHAEKAGHHHPEGGSRPPHRNRHGDVGNVTDAHGARHGGGQSLEVGDLTGLVPFVLFAENDPDGMPEAANVDEAEIEAEEGRPGDQPDDNQRKLVRPDRDRVEDEFGEGPSNGAKGLIDGLVDAQQSLRLELGVDQNLAG